MDAKQKARQHSGVLAGLLFQADICAENSSLRYIIIRTEYDN